MCAQGVAAAVELESQARQDTGMTPEEWMVSNEPRMETIRTAVAGAGCLLGDASGTVSTARVRSAAGAGRPGALLRCGVVRRQ
ncbi:hypothetical protein GCM10010121_093950 [Streptomyces brasiliensis]|uniref:Uncharacterized protein n=1 Tax=Streptomyces brasiliensis TaxID=1954 RepID=A0A917PA82_9ACTN|nr:hypothetical protein GCM10010121_093950 [Streptomyces brasiliensis]